MGLRVRVFPGGGPAGFHPRVGPKAAGKPSPSCAPRRPAVSAARPPGGLAGTAPARQTRFRVAQPAPFRGGRGGGSVRGFARREAQSRTQNLNETKTDNGDALGISRSCGHFPGTNGPHRRNVRHRHDVRHYQRHDDWDHNGDYRPRDHDDYDPGLSSFGISTGLAHPTITLLGNSGQIASYSGGWGSWNVNANGAADSSGTSSSTSSGTSSGSSGSGSGATGSSTSSGSGTGTSTSGGTSTAQGLVLAPREASRVRVCRLPRRSRKSAHSRSRRAVLTRQWRSRCLRASTASSSTQAPASPATSSSKSTPPVNASTGSRTRLPADRQEKRSGGVRLMKSSM